MKINYVFIVFKGQFPVMDYIPNTIILYFIVHCIYVLCNSQLDTTNESEEVSPFPASYVLFCSVQ